LPVTVNIPVALRQYTQNQSDLQVDASTVQEMLQKLDALFPGLKAFILDESSELRRYVNVFVNGKDIRSGDGITTKLKEGDQVRIVPAVAGG
jgi:sulfur-carrier protein